MIDWRSFDRDPIPSFGGGSVRVILNVAMTVDGKIASVRRESFPLGSPEDRRRMDRLRAEADAVIVGSGTMRVDGYPLVVRDPLLAEARRRRGRPHPVNVLMSRSLEVPLDRPFFHHPETERIVFTTADAPASRLRAMQPLAEVIRLPGPDLHPEEVLRALEERGIERVLLEGGGRLNAAFFAAGLVDEVYLTLTPWILGGRDAPTPVDGTGFLFQDRVALELLSCEPVDSEIFLHYAVGGPNESENL
jgi:2,5-diamino-6-(ribosylamino)-4(3H)-pyrimidinone 5'-phosphate reductase